jgi:hypothetical protein
LSTIVLSFTVSCPRLKMPPPSAEAVFPRMIAVFQREASFVVDAAALADAIPYGHTGNFCRRRPNGDSGPDTASIKRWWSPPRRQ